MHPADPSTPLPGAALTDTLEMQHPRECGQRRRCARRSQQMLSPVVRYMGDSSAEDKALLPASWVFKTLVAPD